MASRGCHSIHSQSKLKTHGGTRGPTDFHAANPAQFNETSVAAVAREICARELAEDRHLEFYLVAGSLYEACWGLGHRFRLQTAVYIRFAAGLAERKWKVLTEGRGS